MTPKTLSNVAVGDTVFRFFGGIETPMLLQVTAVTEERIVCGWWQFDKRTGAEIDEFLGCGPALTGSCILAAPAHVQTDSGEHFDSDSVPEPGGRKKDNDAGVRE